MGFIGLHGLNNHMSEFPFVEIEIDDRDRDRHRDSDRDRDDRDTDSIGSISVENPNTSELPHDKMWFSFK